MKSKYRTMLLALCAVMGMGNLNAESLPEGCATQCESSCFEGFFVDGEVLYLKAYEGGLSGLCDRTHTSNVTIDDTVFTTIHGRGEDPDLTWNTGFRIGAGYDFNEMITSVYWTHYHGRSDNSLNRFRLDYDVVDILFKWDYACHSCLTLTPIAGIKVAEIDQKVHTRFDSDLDGLRTHSGNHVKQRFEGFGPLLGFEGNWDFCDYGISAYGNLAIALLYGKNHVKTHGKDVFPLNINRFYFKNRKTHYQCALDFGAGLRWRGTCLSNTVVAQLGFESHRYFNHNQFNDYGDLSLDGVNFGLSVEF